MLIHSMKIYIGEVKYLTKTLYKWIDLLSLTKTESRQFDYKYVLFERNVKKICLSNSVK